MRGVGRPRGAMDDHADDRPTEKDPEPRERRHATHSRWPLHGVACCLEKAQPRLAIAGPVRRVAGRGLGDGSLQAPGASLREHVVEHPASRVHVRPLIHLLAPPLLRRHVRRGPCAVHALGPQQVGEPEVEELHPAVLADEDVRGLQVPVQDASLVSVGKALRHLLGDAQGLGLGDAAFRDPLRQRLAPEEFHHEVGARLARSHVVQRHDAGVVEARHRLGLPLDPVGRQVVPGPGKAKRLHGDDPVQLGVERLVDRAEASPPHLATDLEPADAVPGLELPLPAFEEVLAGGLEDLLEESGERAGLTGARLDRGVALFLALRQGEPPRVGPWRLAGGHRGCHPGLPESAGATGNSTRKVEPLPTSLFNEMVPPCAMTMAREIASPSPAPRPSPARRVV